MRSLVMLCSVWCLASLTGCIGDRCDAPDKPEYSCAPVAAGTANTCGGPVWNGVAYDQDKAFPIGCSVRLPACVAAYPDNVQTCSCEMQGASPQWTCPI